MKRNHSKQSIRTRLTLLGAVVLAALVGDLAMVRINDYRTEASIAKISSKELPKLDAANSLVSDLKDLQRSLQDALAAADTTALETSDELAKGIRSRLDGLRLLEPATQQQTQSLAERFEAYYRTARTTTEQMISNRSGLDVVNLLNQMQAEYLAVRDEFSSLSQAARQHMDTAFADINQRMHETLITSTAIIVVASVILLISAVRLTRSITVPLSEAVKAADALSRGDLTGEIRSSGSDETGQLSVAIRNMITAFRKLILDIRLSSSSLNSSAKEISAATDELFRSSERQSRGAAEVAATSDEMAETVRNLESNVGRVHEASEVTRKLATQGTDILITGNREFETLIQTLQSTGARVKELVESAADIGKVLEVVRDISSQTRLLALNAAIEAARAGQSGRGFEVVAAEVGKLAQKSTEATGQIAEKLDSIRELVAAVELSTGNVIGIANNRMAVGNQLNESLGKILAAADETAILVTELRTTASQQAATASHVAKLIGEMALLSKDNLTGSEEIASTADSLAKLAEQLERSVNQFRLPGGIDGNLNG